MHSTTPGSRFGHDFWLYQIGQAVSTIGDACGNVALAWWVLSATGSAATVSAVLSPAMLAQTVLTPLLGPLGDQISRTRLLFVADILRAFVLAGLAFLSGSGSFVLSAVIGVYVFFGVGSAIFNSNNLSIAPQLVPPESVEGALRASQSLLAVGRVAGGVIGGLLVTWVGPTTAFGVDACSFGVAALATALIKAVPPPARSGAKARTSPRELLSGLLTGLRVVRHIPVLLWLCVAIGVFNLVLSPMHVLLPTFAKQTRDMPPWFLGGLESSIGTGVVLGAVTVGWTERLAFVTSPVIMGLLLVGITTAVIPFAPGPALPMFALVLFGVGAAWTNIPIGTRVSLAVPDAYRSRVNSIFAFLFDSTAPAGVVLGGVLISAVGVPLSFALLGAIILLVTPMLLWVGQIREFFTRPATELQGHFVDKYPHVFDAGTLP